MRVGIVGGGYWGSKHVRVMGSLPEVGELSVIDPRPAVRSQLAARHPGLATYDDLGAALRSLDGVVIATPPTTHARIATVALQAGCHVLVEKPLATSSLDAHGLVQLAAEVNRTLMVGHTFEYHSAVWRLREVVANAELGSLHYLDSARLNLGLYQTDVNVIWDLAPHDVSIINHVLDETPAVVTAWGNAYAHAYLEDVAYLRLEYPRSGVEAQVHVSWLDPRKVRRLTVVGSERMAVYNDLSEEERLKFYDKGVVTPDGSPINGQGLIYRNEGVSSPTLDFEEPLMVQDRHFVECARYGGRPSTDGACGTAVVDVLEAAQVSLREQRPVEVDQMRLAEATSS